jgi:cellulose biosynthesis protein BcsQ
MQSISVFNNKGGVGKTTLTFHLAHALGGLGKKVLMIDADPQCNLTICSLATDRIESIWAAENELIDAGIEDYRAKHSNEDMKSLLATTRTLHFCLMPTEEGTGEYERQPPPEKITSNVHLIPGRLSLHSFEDKIASRWSDAFLGDPLALRTITRIRALAAEYAHKWKYDYVIVDTSPSLGILNKVVISTVDAFFVPATPDMFSLYGIRNIGRALKRWRHEFETMKSLLSDQKRSLFPHNFVSFLGYTIYNAKKYDNKSSPLGLASAHQLFANKLPGEIREYIPSELHANLTDELLAEPIGGSAVIHSHSTYPSVAQTYHIPMWRVPFQRPLLDDHANSVPSQKQRYLDTEDAYKTFALDLLTRMPAGA